MIYSSVLKFFLNSLSYLLFFYLIGIKLAPNGSASEIVGKEFWSIDTRKPVVIDRNWKVKRTPSTSHENVVGDGPFFFFFKNDFKPIFVPDEHHNGDASAHGPERFLTGNPTPFGGAQLRRKKKKKTKTVDSRKRKSVTTYL